MQMLTEFRQIGVGLAAMVLLGACSTGTPSAGGVQTAVAEVPTAVASVDPRLNPTAAVGGGINASNAISADDVMSALKAVPQASQLKLTANSSPPGAKGADVQSVSIIAQDTSGLLKALDATGKRTFGEALLTAAVAAWPSASVSLLVSDSTGGGGQIIGSHAPGSTNTVIVS